MKKVLNEEIKKINKIDIFIISVIVILYSIISFINLGDINAPQTYYKANQNKDIIIELKDTEDIIKLKLYNMNSTSKYEIAVSIDNITYYDVDEVEGTGAYAWSEFKVLKKANYLKIKSLNESYIGELALYDNSGNIIKINNISCNGQTINKLTDEQNLIPDQISFMNSSYFDEIYFARTAYEYIHNIQVYEWVHPPLGKLIQAIPIKISNVMAPFYYRLMGNIAGILMIPVMYLLGKELFKKRKYAIFAALLIALDNFHFSQTRIGTVDSHLVLFMMLAFLFMFRYFNNKNENTNLLLSGLFMGLSICVKWTGLYCALALAIIYLIHVIENKKINKNLVLKSILFFVIIPILLYLGTFYIFPKLLNANYQFSNLINYQKSMYDYHSSVTTPHPFSSKWYTWPLFIKPVWFYNSSIDLEYTSTISNIGNIAIYWFSIIAFIYLIINIFKKKEINSINLLIIVLSLLLPYILIGRVMFQYHYFPVVPFIMLIIVKLFKDLEEKLKTNIFIPLYLILVLIVFIIYYPVSSGLPVSTDYLEKIRLLSTWYW